MVSVNTQERWHAATPTGETLWGWIVLAFVVYWALFVGSSITNQKELNTAGGVFVLAVLAWAVLERLWVKVDGVVVASLAAMLLPLVHVIAGDGIQPSQAIFKHESLCAVMAMSRLLRLPAGHSSKWRLALAVPVLAVLGFSMVAPGAVGDSTRHAGLFVNPNNLALIPFLLLFLVDEFHDPLAVRITVHAIVVAVLLFSGTSGAILAYTIGMWFHMRSRLSPNWRALAQTVALAGTVAVTMIVVGGDDLLPETRLTKQISVMRAQLHNVLTGAQFSYYDQERTLGTGSTSAIWRLAHWRLVIETYADGTTAQHLFGFGVGSSPELLGKLPHNEYLRILFEQGMAGLFLFLFAWRRIIMTAPAAIRYVGLMVAIYSFSENNLDNFPFMSLFVLFLSATELCTPAVVRSRLKQADCRVIRFPDRPIFLRRQHHESSNCK